MDFIVGTAGQSRTGIMAVEVKTNGGYYSYDQRMKDWALMKYRGTVIGGNLIAPLYVGSRLQIPVSVVRVWTTN